MVEVSMPLAPRTMERITILNRCHRFRGFVYQHAHFGATRRASKSPCGRPRVRRRFARAATNRRPAMTNLPNAAWSSFPSGFFRLPALHHAARQLRPLRRRGRRRGSLERRQTYVDQSLYAVPSPLGEATVMERDGGAFRTSGKGFRRRRTRCHCGLEHRTFGQIDTIGVDEIQYAKATNTSR